MLAEGGVVEETKRAMQNVINLLEGSLGSLQPGSRNIILGRLLAYDLGVRLGDSVVLLIPRPTGDGSLEPRLERFVLSGVFEAGLQEHDSVLALASARDAAGVLGIGDSITSIRFRTDDVMAAPAVSAKLAGRLRDGIVTSDWTVENASYFRAIRLEKMMMSILLSLRVAPVL